MGAAARDLGAVQQLSPHADYISLSHIPRVAATPADGYPQIPIKEEL